MRCVFCRPQGQGALRICEDDGLHGGHSFIGVRLRVCVYVCMYVCWHLGEGAAVSSSEGLCTQ